MHEKFLLKRDEIDQMEGVEKTHFLNPNAKRLNKSLGDEVGLTGIGVHIIEVQPGRETTEFHKHYFEDEFVYVLEGQATLFVGDKSFSIGVGDFIGHKKGVEPHSITNTGDSVLKCLVVGERLEHDVSEYPKLGKRLYRNKGMDWNLVDLASINTPKRAK